MAGVIEFKDPRSTIATDEVASAYKLYIEPGPCVVALFSNGFFGASRFLGHLEASLSPAAPEFEFLAYEKAMPSGPAPGRQIDEIVMAADAVISAFGHCGSCTSGIVQDAIEIALHQIPSVVLIAERFWKQSEFIARAVGMPDIPRVMTPYPIGGASDEVMASVTTALAPMVLAALREKREA